MTTKLSKFVGRYDFRTEHKEFTIKMLVNEKGKNASKKRTCKRQQQRVTEIMESAVSGEESTSSIQNQEPGRLNSQSLTHHLLFLLLTDTLIRSVTVPLRSSSYQSAEVLENLWAYEKVRTTTVSLRTSTDQYGLLRIRNGR
ncbi:hypothetical protein DPMN_118283 [Dreissena polymorpha]|uniref:Uncharacterized protein n=1 Tax=Dreissena polymorpha TaxID=45954 RepID=A0A9D4GJT1_DREPO|nr:hypothetical protein DPMN_118283 [Dreissena polymorpha]